MANLFYAAGNLSGEKMIVPMNNGVGYKFPQNHGDIFQIVYAPFLPDFLEPLD
jgi:hypothetical protein